MTTAAEIRAARDALDAAKAATTDPDELRSLAARRAHLTRKLAAAAKAAPAAPASPAAINAPLTPAQIVAETTALLDEFLLTGWTAKVSGLLTRAYGVCDYRRREVRISAGLAERNPASQTRDTIAHEVAHAIAGPGAKHGPAWKQACRQTGATPKACYDGAAVTPVPQRYVARCVACREVVKSTKIRPQWGMGSDPSRYHKASRCSAAHGPRNLVWTDTRA